MEVNSTLNGLKVLVTRPQHQAASLCKKVNKAGGEAIAFPTIDIVPLVIREHADLNQQDMIVFVSRNAVLNFTPQLRRQLSDTILKVAVGSSTATCMREQGIGVDIQAPPPAGSESLLAVSELQSVEGKRVLIVRGEDGREFLAETLTERGAVVSYLEVYQRRLPQSSTEQIAQAQLAECIIISSVNSLVNLCQLLGEENIKNKHLIVVSKRIKQYAIEQGFKHIDVAEDASDTALMEQLMKVGQTNDRK